MNAASLLAAGRAALQPGSAAGSALASLAIRAGGMALFFAQSVLFARLLGPADFGMLAVVLSLAELAAVFALCGFGIYALREVPRLRAGRDEAGIRTFWRAGAATIALASLFAGAAGLAAALAWGREYGWLMLFALPLIPALAFGQFTRGMVHSAGQPLTAQWPGEVLRPLVVCLLLGVMAASLARLSPPHALGAVVAGGLMAAGAGWWQVQRELRPMGHRPAAPGEVRQWRGAAFPLLGSALAQMLHLALATLLLGALSGAKEAGLFQPVARISPLLLIPAQAAAMHYAPQIAALWEQRQILTLRQATWANAALSTGLTLALGLALIVAGPWILLAFGPEFSGGAPMLLAVAAAQVLACAFGPAGWLLAMTGHEMRLLHGYLAALAVQLLLGLWLIPDYGAWGATIALGGGILALPALQLWQVRQQLGFGCSILARSKP